MLNCAFYWVDAFTMGPFTGNPAGVCPLESWPSDELLQKIAAQNGLAETAFFVPISDGHYHLRWFTPAAEIDLCGHATLASAHVIFNELGFEGPTVNFRSMSGNLSVSKTPADRLALDFPSRPATSVEPSELPIALLSALSLPLTDLTWAGRARDWLFVLPDEARLAAIKPDFAAIIALDTAKTIITALGRETDFVSRFFAPQVGVPEDHVTGSAHCTLIPYWSARLNRNALTAIPRSSRGGRLWCEQLGDRVCIAGKAKSYIRGSLAV
jgi:PhzF family phenazine biosynthesis protein